MRIDVAQYLFIGINQSKDTFFKECQELGIIEFFSESPIKKTFSKESKKYSEAISVLCHHQINTHQLHKTPLEKAPNIANEIISLNKKLSSLIEQKQLLSLEYGRIYPFGYFSLEKVRLLEKELHRTVRFFSAKREHNFAQVFSDLILINTLDDVDHFISFSKEPLQHPDLIEIIFEHSLEETKKQLKVTKQEISHCEHALKEYTRHFDFLHKALLHEINSESLIHAKETIVEALDDHVFIARGWVPVTKVKELEQLAKTYHVHIEEVLNDHHQTVPTYLENKDKSRIGEDLVHIFDVPSNTDKDPSLWVLFAFSLFFSIVVGDGGYGLIFLVTALLLNWKTKKMTSFMKRMIRLTIILGVFSVAWGFVVHSFFGISLSDNNILKKYSPIEYVVEQKAAYHMEYKDSVYESWGKQIPSITHATTAQEFLKTIDPKDPGKLPIHAAFTDNIMLECAIFIGALHIILGMFRYSRKNPSQIGWAIFLTGAYLYLPNYLNATSFLHFLFDMDKAKSGQFGLQLICLGFTLAVVIALFRNGITGIFESLVVIQIFADVLSYLRLYALGLAGSIVMGVVNDMSTNLPLLIGIFVIFFGHCANIILAAAGGVIHGLRLNFLEWYHYSFEGGGKKFQPLCLETFE